MSSMRGSIGSPEAVLAAAVAVLVIVLPPSVLLCQNADADPAALTVRWRPNVSTLPRTSLVMMTGSCLEAPEPLPWVVGDALAAMNSESLRYWVRNRSLNNQGWWVGNKNRGEGATERARRVSNSRAAARLLKHDG